MIASPWMDITLPLSDETPVLVIENSGTPPVPEARIYRFFDVEKGDLVTMSRLEIASHEGTHIDAPLHFIPGGTTIDAMPVETAVGPARVIEIQDSYEIRIPELEKHDIREGDRLLFKTANTGRVWKTRRYTGEYVALSWDAADYLASKKVRLVGMDYLTIAHEEPPENINNVHKALLRNGIFILEGLDLSGVEPGDYEMLCLPLRLEHGDAAPCRVVIRRLQP